MRPHLLLLLLALTAALALGPPAAAQAAFPHLVVRDGLGAEVPPPGGPFDNTGEITVVGGMVLELEITYQANAQPNTNVLYGLLVSAAPTGLPLTTLPPQLYTDAPFLVVTFGTLTLDVTGTATNSFLIPQGIYSGEAYIQGIVLDSSNNVPVQLANGVKLSFAPPGFNVSYAYMLNQVAEIGQFRELGVIDIDPETGSDLLPIGDTTAPETMPVDPGAAMGIWRFLDTLPNVPDGPINPHARPLTSLNNALTGPPANQFTALDTSWFPRRGRLMIPIPPSANPTQSPQTKNLWADKVGNNGFGPNVEMVAYDGFTGTEFLNTVRSQVGSKGSFNNAQLTHAIGDRIVGDYTMATSMHARSRSKVCLDASNRDAPCVVIPPFTFTPTGGGGPVTMDLDLYRFQTVSNSSQAFVVLDRASNTWRVLDGTQKTPAVGTWDPMVAVSPDRRFMVASVRAKPDGNNPNWDHLPDQLWAIRLDGENWPATGSITWQLTFDLFPGPTQADSAIRGRRIHMPATFIIGPDPENYLVFCGLNFKFRRTDFGGNNRIASDPQNEPANFIAWEAESLREEAIIQDYFVGPLVPPGSTKSPPSLPRPMIRTQFGSTGFGTTIERFDPGVILADDRTAAAVTAGHSIDQEDVFVVSGAGITQGGVATYSLINVTGHRNSPNSAGQFGGVRQRWFGLGGHGQGGKGAFSPSGDKVAFIAAQDSRRDWLQVAGTNGIDFAKVLNLMQNTADQKFFIPGTPFDTNRVITGLTWAGEDDLVFLMGRQPYSDPLAFDNSLDTAAMDIFAYNIPNKTLTNLTETGGSQFGALGKIDPAGFWTSPNGDFVYYVRRGKVGTGASIPSGSTVANIIGVNLNTLAVFDVSGDEFGTGSLIPHLTLASGEAITPVETLAGMHFSQGAGVQEGMVYFTAQRFGGNGADDVFAVNSDSPFIALPVSSSTIPGVQVTNLVANAWGAQVAFARTDTPALLTTNQHPFVVDLTSFLFERDLLPSWTSGGMFTGRVMDGSFRFLPPAGTAPSALVFAFGLFVQAGDPFAIAQTCAPTYYPLASVGDPIAEPIAVTLPLVDTAPLGLDFRFYVANAIPFPGTP